MHNMSSAQAAVEHLIEIGRRRIAVIGAELDGDDEASSASLRLKGYLRALEQAGIELDPILVRPTAMSQWNRAGGAAATHRLVAEGVDFDAVFALNDTLGLGVLRALVEERVRVPDDVAVIGFDNIDEGKYSIPSMSTVDTGRDEIARIAVDRLIERINEKGERRPPETIKPDFRIVRRESTGFVSTE